MNILVLGDGGWGTAIALLLDKNGHNVTLWSNFPDYARLMAKKRENTKFLPGIKLPSSIKITSNLQLITCNLVVMAIPTQYSRSVLSKLKTKIYNLKSTIPIVSVAKGLEMGTLKRPSEIITEVLGTDKIAVLSGPSHAEEVSRGLPASVVIASKNMELAKMAQSAFMNSHFRPYTHSDITGVELGGAIKNIIAIAAGICDGLKLGDNTKSALLTRGLAEIARLGKAMGAHQNTFFGLSGLGDLITTCVSPHGRNRAVGMQLGQGKTLRQIMASMEMVAEGVWTTKAAIKLSNQYKIEMPITKEVYNILFRRKDPKQAVRDLMGRRAKSETEDLCITKSPKLLK
ncbi:MAG: NAD(P)-dependent glycerol-3-phosphate dehydrogenase [Planctomycetes bacterium]|nr:NAD(P)-dependent glycerol-3-phosphate dehydrogenase [Planctomycetota bacterium]